MEEKREEIRRDALIRKRHTMAKTLWDAQSIKNFVVVNPRDIRKSQVNRILHGLERGENWESTVWTNLRKDIHRIIDGAHRKMAAEIYFTRHPERKIEVALGVYDNLTDAEEKIEYTRLNRGVSETVNDYVQKRWNDIPITKLLTKKQNFPIDVSYKWKDSAMEFKQLVGIYMTKDRVPYVGGYAHSKEEFVDDAKELGHSDVKILKSFLEDYISIFGPPSRTNIHYKPGIYYALFKIWWDNRTRFNPSEMTRKLKKIFMHPIVQRYSECGINRSMASICRDDMLRIINGTKTIKLLTKSDAELQWERSKTESQDETQSEAISANAADTTA